MSEPDTLVTVRTALKAAAQLEDAAALHDDSGVDLGTLSYDMSASLQRQQDRIGAILASQAAQEATLGAILQDELEREDKLSALRRLQAEHQAELNAMLDRFQAHYDTSSNAARAAGVLPPGVMEGSLEFASSSGSATTRAGSEHRKGDGTPGSVGRKLPGSPESAAPAYAEQPTPPKAAEPTTPKARARHLAPAFPALPSPPFEYADPDDTDSASESSFMTAAETVRGASPPPPARFPRPAQHQTPYCYAWNWDYTCRDGPLCPRGARHACWNCFPAAEPSYHRARACPKGPSTGTFVLVP
ncbi:hypothetical protein Q8F55_002770 [Vanrija albida]|uniref:Uncharacterized protein n=1 Tax=Vanrija albida TaxID=181172 RepID=A0ABR3QAP5_9TREE